MFNKLHKTTDFVHFGINTTKLNREFIIRFREKTEDGKLKRARLITGRQLVELIGPGETMDRLIEKLNTLREDKLYRKLRNTGQLEFVWR